MADQRSEIRALIQQKYATAEKGDYFALLGVNRTASSSEVRKAYFDLVKKLHPDRLGQYGLAEMKTQAARLFHVLTQAYETLSDPKRRQEYASGQTTAATPEAGAMKATGVQNAEAAKIAFHKGSVMLNKRAYQEAEKFFAEATEARPDMARYWQSLGWAIFNNPKRPEDQRVENARKCFEKALDLDAEDAQTHYNVGLYWKAKGNPNRTKRALEKAIELKPDFIEAKRELRLLEMRQRKKKNTARQRKRTETSGIFARFFNKKK